jgi:hypothetical protein
VKRRTPPPPAPSLESEKELRERVAEESSTDALLMAATSWIASLRAAGELHFKIVLSPRECHVLAVMLDELAKRLDGVMPHPAEPRSAGSSPG